LISKVDFKLNEKNFIRVGGVLAAGVLAFTVYKYLTPSKKKSTPNTPV
jgi:uncharacterized membrane protein YebE (DUF533 family)